MINWLIKLLGGYTMDEWHKRVYELDKKHDAAIYEKDKQLEDALQYVKKTVDGCTRGEWCECCAFGKRLSVSTGEWPYNRHHYTHICQKGDSCKEFVERGVESNG